MRNLKPIASYGFWRGEKREAFFSACFDKLFCNTFWFCLWQSKHKLLKTLPSNQLKSGLWVIFSKHFRCASPNNGQRFFYSCLVFCPTDPTIPTWWASNLSRSNILEAFFIVSYFRYWALPIYHLSCCQWYALVTFCTLYGCHTLAASNSD